MRRCRHQRGYLRSAGRRRSGLLGRTRRLPGTVRVAQQTFSGAAVEHRLDVLPGVHHLVRRGAGQLHVPTPRVEVRRVRLHVLVRRADTMRMEDELVRREEQAAVRALDTLGTRAVVASGQEGAAAAPGAFMVNGEREIFGQSARRVMPIFIQHYISSKYKIELVNKINVLQKFNKCLRMCTKETKYFSSKYSANLVCKLNIVRLLIYIIIYIIIQHYFSLFPVQ